MSIETMPARPSRYGELARAEGHVEAYYRASIVCHASSMICRDHSTIFPGSPGGSRRSDDKVTCQSINKALAR
ncbi:hypothetical protein OPV22_013683 [Ensete ventricosum]|uniref:Uncharacterized protein n=1 Tax=Ensete ventricosum TaxID=4639 RepID=A0AAV8QW32_ENSVE|nr:hypothetical protein OPV22_013683 [Ensete ventricosum]